jgi:NAD(P)-dependent dehydrogenase (short-subunit alcohol dehydrogenase family)
VLVTGASSGIGRACVETAASRGFHVVATVRTERDAEALRDGHDLVHPVVLDLTDPAAPVVARDAVEAIRHARLRGLVNCAGISVQGPVELLDAVDWRHQFDVNLFGPIALIRALLPLLRSAHGRIVNISSAGGRVSSAFLGPYSASKFALEAMSDALRQELAPHRIHVSLIEPGSVATPMWEKGLADGRRRLGELDPDADRLYGPPLRALLRTGERLAARGVAASKVAAAVDRALTDERPRTRYLVGLDAHLQIRLKTLLPDRALDALLASVTGTRRAHRRSSGAGVLRDAP